MCLQTAQKGLIKFGFYLAPISIITNEELKYFRGHLSFHLTGSAKHQILPLGWSLSQTGKLTAAQVFLEMSMQFIACTFHFRLPHCRGMAYRMDRRLSFF